MSPKAYSQSMAHAQKQGVLIGFEFEVCVPKSQIQKTLSKLKGNKPEDYIRLFMDLFNDNLDFLTTYDFDDVFKVKPDFLIKIPKSNKTFNNIEDAVNKMTDLDWSERVDSDYIYKALKYNNLVDPENFIDKFSFNLPQLKSLLKNYIKYREEVELLDDNDYEFDYPGSVRVLKPAITKTFGEPIVFDSYHENEKDNVHWYIEPDPSLEVNEPGDGAAEIVGPPQTVEVAENTLKKFFQLAKKLNLYTNKKTGLHINMSLPDINSIDVLKLMLFTGDRYVLKQFDREFSEYARSVLNTLENEKPASLNIAYNNLKRQDYNKKLEYINSVASILTMHRASIAKGDSGNYFSFRHIGKDYLNQQTDIMNALGRFARALLISSDTNMYRNEYLKKLYQLVEPGKEKYDVIQQNQKIPSKEIIPVIRDIKLNGMPVLELNVADPYGYIQLEHDIPWDVEDLKRKNNLRIKNIQNSKDNALIILKQAFPNWYTEERLSNRKLTASQVYFYPIDIEGSLNIMRFVSLFKNDMKDPNNFYRMIRVPLTDRISKQLLQNITVQLDKQKMLGKKMRRFEFITEDFADRDQIYRDFKNIFEKVYNNEITDIMSILPRAKKLAKQLGRRTSVYGYVKTDYPTPGQERYYSSKVGRMIDELENRAYNQQLKSGVSPIFPAGNEASMKQFANNLARYFKGFNARPDYLRGCTHVTSFGQRYRQSQYGVKFNTQEDLNDAWEIIKEKGKRIYLRTVLYSAELGNLSEFVKIGKYLVRPYFYQQGFRDPERYLEIITVSGMQKGKFYKQIDISDQQAQQLIDIANTRFDNVFKQLELLIKVLNAQDQSKDVIKQAIDSSNKIDLATKAKLNKIIAGAKDFKEPDDDNQ